MLVNVYGAACRNREQRRLQNARAVNQPEVGVEAANECEAVLAVNVSRLVKCNPFGGPFADHGVERFGRPVRIRRGSVRRTKCGVYDAERTRCERRPYPVRHVSNEVRMSQQSEEPANALLS